MTHTEEKDNFKTNYNQIGGRILVKCLQPLKRLYHAILVVDQRYLFQRIRIYIWVFIVKLFPFF